MPFNNAHGNDEGRGSEFGVRCLGLGFLGHTYLHKGHTAYDKLQLDVQQ